MDESGRRDIYRERSESGGREMLRERGVRAAGGRC